ncbi:VCBS repeat-containing protein [Chloroflexi bacterium TSY]|nr:VCBS repeat-containing protein [Chloroflexi bacterium TSY]
MDGDGDLDLAVGNLTSVYNNKLYLNEGGTLATTASWTSDDADATLSNAWGDVDGDGDLDLAAGNVRSIKLYVNERGTLATDTSWTSDDGDATYSVAWGDVDGDGDLDLAVGNKHYLDSIPPSGAPNKLYLNEGGTPVASWVSDDTEYTTSVAWGDVDGDGDLDLAVGNEPSLFPNDSSGSNKLYLNEGGTLTTTPVWASEDKDQTYSIAWGDVDGDGDLDLAVVDSSPLWFDTEGNFGYGGAPNKLYLNEGGTLARTATWASEDKDHTYSVAWGDVDGDGDLDLAVGNDTCGCPVADSGQNKVYLNDGGVLAQTAAWTSDDLDATLSIAWGDVDGDGDLDLAVGNLGSSNKLYLNEGGMLARTATWTSNDSDRTASIAWGDVDGDGDLDLAVGNWSGPKKVYQNEGGTLATTAAWTLHDDDVTNSIAWGDVDGDSALDLAVGNLGAGFGDNLRYSLSKLYRNSAPLRTPFGQPALIKIGQPNTDSLSANANFYAVPTIHQTGQITIPYTISASDTQSVHAVQAFYSLNGGDDWQPAIGGTRAIVLDQTPPSIIDPASTPRIFLPVVASAGTGSKPLLQFDNAYVWDVYASGFFGQSDNVVFRLEAHLTCVNTCQRAYVATQTFPFRVRGTQVRVLNQDNQPQVGAVVYQLKENQQQDARPIASAGGTLFQTDGQGYLQGSGALATGDRLAALAPITATAKYTVYHTSAAPILDGLDWSTGTVDRLGVQALTVSADQPLILFNLDVSLEWDARQDQTYLQQLQDDLKRTSELLYDWTNGQAALGKVTVYHAKGHWETADIRIHATNRLRPHATIGGIFPSLRLDTVPQTDNGPAATHLYAPGHVEMGVVWNRYGDVRAQSGEDWARTLAHELGHYLFFLHDNYIGLDDAGQVIRIERCPGVMSDPYGDANSEFHPAQGWLPRCADTFSQRKLGRYDWATIKAHYPWLHEPSGAIDAPQDAGPRSLPLVVTAVRFVITTESPPLVAPSFSLVREDGRTVSR